MQTVNHAAVSELLKEAEIMARLRHPNIVWVYGVVLPPPQEPQEYEDDEDFDTPLPGEGPFEIGAACHVGHCLAAAGMALAAAAPVGTASLPWDQGTLLLRGLVGQADSGVYVHRPADSMRLACLSLARGA